MPYPNNWKKRKFYDSLPGLRLRATAEVLVEQSALKKR